MNKIFSKKRNIAILLLPGLLVFILSVVGPIFLSFYYSIQQWDGISEPIFVGLSNFKRLFHDRQFWSSLKNSLTISLALICIQHPIAFLVSNYMLRVESRYERIFKIIFFLPAIISVVVTSKMWANILDQNHGLINTVLSRIGLVNLQQAWLSDPKYAMWSIIIIVMWQGFGWAMLIYYTGLKNLPVDVYEASRIDGVSKKEEFLHITLPLMKPVIHVNFTLALISGLKQMETVYLTTNGGPNNYTQVVANYLYKTAFSAMEYGYANAISIAFVLITVILTILMRKAFEEDTE